MCDLDSQVRQLYRWDWTLNIDFQIYDAENDMCIPIPICQCDFVTQECINEECVDLGKIAFSQNCVGVSQHCVGVSRDCVGGDFVNFRSF